MVLVVQCESNFDPTIQSNLRYTFSDPKRGIIKGERELSFGVVQISLPHHPYISKEQALDEDFALNYLADQLAKGKGNMWTCYRNIVK